MDFDVIDLLGNLFGGGPTMATVAAVPGPDDDGGRFADWVRRPDCHGRMGWEAPGLPESDRWWAWCDFDDLPLPGPACPVCNSLESWTDLLGRERCKVCEANILDKALQLAEKSARLRKQAQPRKPAPRVAPCCVSGGMVDTLDLGDNRPLQGQLEGFGGVEG